MLAVRNNKSNTAPHRAACKGHESAARALLPQPIDLPVTLFRHSSEQSKTLAFRSEMAISVP
eukprot:8914328-Prorocentrum_lima.AAC.1